MIPPSLPENESERLQSLAEHNLLDTLPEEVYDDITRLAAEICGTPIAAINLIAGEHLWPKSAVGIESVQSPREHSYCAHAILNPYEPLVVPDARYDERFFDNPNVAGGLGVVFYAGVPVQDAQGRALGSLCVCDTRPRELSELKLDSLRALAKLVSTHFQLRRTHLKLELVRQQVRTAEPIVQRLVAAMHRLQPESTDSQARSQLDALQQEISTLSSTLAISQK
jgi:GAF domain-containing protein